MNIRTQSIFKNKFLFFIPMVFSGIILVNSIESSILKNSNKEVIDHVWQIIYRDFLDSDGDFNRSNWIKLRKKLLTRKYANSSDGYDAIREMLAKLNDPYTIFLYPKQFYENRIDT